MFLYLLLYLAMFPHQTHSYTVEIEDYQFPRFESEFVLPADEIEVYHVLYRFGVISPNSVPQRVKDARPLPPYRPDPLPIRYFEYPYYDFGKRIMIFITVNVNYV